MTENITMGAGGSNEHTVYASVVELIKKKDLLKITPPTTFKSTNPSTTPKSTIIVDLLRGAEITGMWNIDGEIDYADRDKFINLFNTAGTFTMTYNGTNYTVCFEKLGITEKAGSGGTPSSFTVKFTVIEGINYTSAS